MVQNNTGLVNHVLRRRRTDTDEWDDAYQDGLLGLMRATQMYNPTLGWRFSTYAIPWIRQAVSRGRGRQMGRSWRSNQDGVGPWHQPLSLDQDITGHQQGLADLLPTNGPDPAQRAVDLELLRQTARHAHTIATDPIDQAIVDSLLHDDPTRARTPLDTAIAQQHGVSREIIRQRRTRLQARLRNWAQGVA